MNQVRIVSIKWKRFIVISFLSLLFLLSGCKKSPKLISPENDATVKLVSKGIFSYLSHVHECPDSTAVTDYTAKSRAQDVVLSWQSDAETFTVLLSTNSDLSNGTEYHTDKQSLKVSNLLTGTTYYWQVHTEQGASEVFFFTTLPTTRWISFPSFTDLNCRDLGGYATTSGKRVKQGMLYRGAELNYHTQLTEEVREVLVTELGIRTDLDLRWANQMQSSGIPLTESPLGADIQYILAPIAPYGELNKPQAENVEAPEYPVYTQESIQKIFTLLAEEENYPIYFHCWGGADRTGCLAFLINGMLGVDYVNLLADYEQTTFSGIIRTKDASYPYSGENYGLLYQEFLAMLRTYGDETSSYEELCQQYLMEFAGITDQQIQTIRGILLE